jgi:hypothetical protein
MSRSIVYCTFCFEAYHHWVKAPEAVAFLRSPHRHVFHVRAEMDVQHNDREVEFITLKGLLVRAVKAKLIDAAASVSTWSCEHWAQWLLDTFKLSRVEVSEDGENGAVVTN